MVRLSPNTKSLLDMIWEIVNTGIKKRRAMVSRDEIINRALKLYIALELLEVTDEETLNRLYNIAEEFLNLLTVGKTFEDAMKIVKDSLSEVRI